MTAIQLLTRAIQYDIDGRKLESLKLYEDGITELLKVCKAEPDSEKKKHFQNRILEYMERAEKVKSTIQAWSSRGEIRDKINIIDGATNYSYERIFGKYFNDEVKDILVDEPWIKDFYQICNLVMFCELAVTKCRNLKCIKVTTNKDTKPESDQTRGFTSLIEDLAKRNITLIVDYTSNLHDRQILLSNGFIIKIGRGLNYFKPLPSRFCLGAFNFDFRECRETNVDIFYCPENKK